MVGYKKMIPNLRPGLKITTARTIPFSKTFNKIIIQDGFASNFIMKGGFPPREIMDNGETIKQGDLLGCIIIQSLVR
jgi:hypothetical protein